MTKVKKTPDKTLVSLKKAHGLITKIIDMKEEGRYCVDIMQQNLAVIGLLKSINQNLLESHLNSCFKAAMDSGNSKQQKSMINEILQLNKLSNK
ncbi:metal-sensing transcriptional repressor [Candidatus Parcubacteria bacterium]|jgi:CsoR family transcriptional regulator, copper-sensing transcriptional repressor|nr:metal-sensing transcriptional repressor [Candidatus Parcubacteria bacterium]